jgi:hypothetical protein
MKPKLTTFDGKNRQAAAVILEDPATYGPHSLLAEWALLVSERARADVEPEPSGQRELFEVAR